jgi:hypothetical protein
MRVDKTTTVKTRRLQTPPMPKPKMSEQRKLKICGDERICKKSKMGEILVSVKKFSTFQNPKNLQFFQSQNNFPPNYEQLINNCWTRAKTTIIITRSRKVFTQTSNNGEEHVACPQNSCGAIAARANKHKNY